MPRSTTNPIRTAVVAAIVVALAAGALTGAVTAQTDQPTITVSDVTVEPGDSATVDVVLTSAPDGLAGYALELTVEGDGAAVEGASYPDVFGLTSQPEIADDGTSVTLEAADLGENVQPGAAGVVLATVELNGEAAGEAGLSVEPLQFDTDGGGTMNPATEAGTVTVGGDADAETEASDASGSAASSGDGEDDATDDTDAAASSAGDAGGDETTSTAFALPAGGLVLTALALAFVVAFVARRRR
ncbi:hypothetical protein [Salinigranum salinum]|uniref:hypothetical protein n=1 Tax=Salinigranum salinum TaxID=1364937 RepID=UPI00126048E4|nr:hypothetical protein [Salinigranum salinum]